MVILFLNHINWFHIVKLFWISVIEDIIRMGFSFCILARQVKLRMFPITYTSTRDLLCKAWKSKDWIGLQLINSVWPESGYSLKRYDFAPIKKYSDLCKVDTCVEKTLLWPCFRKILRYHQNSCNRWIKIIIKLEKSTICNPTFRC